MVDKDTRDQTDKKHLVIIGDVHGKSRSYVDIARKYKYSLQIGDMGFDYSHMKILNYKKHKLFFGNHDNYDVFGDVPHNLGDYGFTELGGRHFYFVRGGFSIDVEGRLQAERRGHTKCWWRDEQLSMDQLTHTIDDYNATRPQTMVTHTCPQEIARMIGKSEVLREFGFDPNTFRTHSQMALQACFEIHQLKCESAASHAF